MVRPFRQSAAQARTGLRNRRLQKKARANLRKRFVSKKKGPRTSTLNQLIKHVPDSNVPVVVFPNVSSFRSITNRLKGSKKKITAAMIQRGGRLVPISV